MSGSDTDCRTPQMPGISLDLTQDIRAAICTDVIWHYYLSIFQQRIYWYVSQRLLLMTMLSLPWRGGGAEIGGNADAEMQRTVISLQIRHPYSDWSTPSRTDRHLRRSNTTASAYSTNWRHQRVNSIKCTQSSKVVDGNGRPGPRNNGFIDDENIERRGFN